MPRRRSLFLGMVRAAALGLAAAAVLSLLAGLSLVLAVALQSRRTPPLAELSVFPSLHSCGGTPILVPGLSAGSGAFEECLFQCTDPAPYFLVFADVDPQTGNLAGRACGKDPSLAIGSHCDPAGGVELRPCDSGIGAQDAVSLGITFGAASSRFPSFSSTSPSSPPPVPFLASSVSSRSPIASSSARSSIAPDPWFLTQHALSSASSSSAIVATGMISSLFSASSESSSFPSPSPSSRCGNGAVDPGEECDQGSRNGTGYCSSDCRLMEGILPRCGDGIPEAGEECDQGSRNGVPGVPCSFDCRRVTPSSAVPAHAAAFPASVLPTFPPAAPQGKTGPATLAVMAAGAAAGFAWMRRRRKKCLP